METRRENTSLLDSLVLRLWNTAAKEGYEGHSFWIGLGRGRQHGKYISEKARKTSRREVICERVTAKGKHRKSQRDSLSDCPLERTNEQ